MGDHVSHRKARTKELVGESTVLLTTTCECGEIFVEGLGDDFGRKSSAGNHLGDDKCIRVGRDISKPIECKTCASLFD